MKRYDCETDPCDEGIMAECDDGEYVLFKDVSEIALMLPEQVAISLGLKCPNCDDVGWYLGVCDGDAQQIQCEFCYTVEDSVFNVRKRLEAKDDDKPMTATEVMRRQEAAKPIKLEYLFTEIGKSTSPQMAYRDPCTPMDRWVRCHLTDKGLVLGPPK